MNSPALHIAPALPVYFSEFPLPDRSPYSIAVDMGVLRSEMAAGNVRQRRAYKNMPQTFGLTFHMHTAELELWQTWVNLYAYDWFYMPLASMYSRGGPPPEGHAPGLISMHIARFISNTIELTMDGHDWWAASVAAEISPDMFAQAPVQTGNRIDALHPADALPDSIDGGSPADPSPGGPIDGGSLSAIAALASTLSAFDAFRESVR